MSSKIYYLTVVAIENEEVLGAYSGHKKKDDFQAAASKVISNSSKIEAGKRIHLTADQYHIHFIADSENILYIGITSSDYPKRVARRLVDELKNNFFEIDTASIRKQFKDFAKALSSKYADPAKVDKVVAARNIVNRTADQLEEGLEKMEQNVRSTETLAQDANLLLEESGKVKESAHTFHAVVRCRRIKMTVAIVGVAILVIAVIVVLGNI